MFPSSLSTLANHLWQSTLFAGVAGLLTLALRNNPARVRHGLWLTASCKFLIPLSVLIALGGHIQWRKAPQREAALPFVIEEVSQPFTAPISSPSWPAVPPSASPLPTILFGIWAAGFIGIAGSWWIRWKRIRATVRAASPAPLEIPIPAFSSPTQLEPGIFGIFRPVLVLPEGITERLTPAQLKAVIAHELCHVRHRDNLIAAMHMFVETVFWFHPLVWWIGKRMVEERERACDEEVRRTLAEPKTYAEGILNICKLYVESPLKCVSRVTGGSNLKKRIEAIMKNRAVLKLNFGKKLALAAAGAAALTLPIIVGMMNAPRIQAQSPRAATPKFEVASIRPCEDGGMGVRGGGGGAPSPGRLNLPCRPVRRLIEQAYVFFADGHAHVWPPRIPIEGAPAWIDSSQYRIEAKAESPQSQGIMNGPMLQTLLEDRFKLKIRRETREVPVYALTAAKGRPNLQPFKEGSCIPFDVDDPQSLPPPEPGKPLSELCGMSSVTTNGYDLFRTTMAEFSTELSNRLDRPVIDKTGIAGRFNIHLDLSTTDLGYPDPALRDSGAPQPPVDYALIADAMRAEVQKLGLKLEPTKGPGEFLVIDHVERPSEN